MRPARGWRASQPRKKTAADLLPNTSEPFTSKSVTVSVTEPPLSKPNWRGAEGQRPLVSVASGTAPTGERAAMRSRWRAWSLV
jgi:hypothetical protein